MVIVANRRRVRQCHAAAAALLWVMGRREAGLSVIRRRLHLRYAVTRDLVCAAKPSSPPRVTLTLYPPFRTILPKRDFLAHVRYRDGARVTDILAYLCWTLSEPNQSAGVLLQSRGHALFFCLFLVLDRHGLGAAAAASCCCCCPQHQY